MPQEFDVLVIGAGQAGLGLGYYLRNSGLDYLLLDSSSEVGASWRNRWDSLTLFTPAEYASLPGLTLGLPAGTYPGKDEVADYLRNYAAFFSLPVRPDSKVVSLAREGRRFRVATENGLFLARQVVVATGPFHEPHVPSFARALSPEIFQVHSSSYRNPGLLPPGPVLVVGAGNSGWQIAEEIASSREVVLSGRNLPRLPRRLLGKSLFWWLETVGVMRRSAQGRFGQRMRSNDDIVIGPLPKELLRSGRLATASRAVSAHGEFVSFEDGSEVIVRNIVWATGFRPDFSWVDLPVFGDDGYPVHVRGVTDEAGLYFLGLRWLHTTGSSLLGWVGRDAEFLAAQIVRGAAEN